MMQRGFRVFLVVFGLLLGVMASAQRFSSVTVEFMTGDRGLADANQLSLIFQGEGGVPLAEGRVSPPRGPGWASRTRQTVSVRLDREVVLRQVARVVFRVSNRTGGSVFDSWDLVSASVRSGTQLLMNAPSIRVRLSAERTNWTSPDWPTFDPQGTNTKTSRWQLVTLTGGDDLRDDNVASYLVIWRDGSFSGFALENLPGNNNRVDTLRVLAPGRSLNDIHTVALVMGDGTNRLVPYAEGVRQETGYAPTRTEDFWDLREATLRAVLPDGAMVTRPLPRFPGRRGFLSLVSQSFLGAISLPGNLPGPRPGTEVAILLWVESDNFNLSGQMADLEAALVKSGSTVPQTVVMRQNSSQEMFSNARGNGIWVGSAISGQRLRYLRMLHKTVRPWESDRNEITGLRLRLRPFPSNTSAAYSGPSTLNIKGYALMQRVSGRGPLDANGLVNVQNEWTFLAADFRLETLSARRPEVTLPIRYTRAR